MLKSPDKFFLPFFALFFALDIGESLGHTHIGGVDIFINWLLVLVFEAIFFIPDIQRGILHLDFLGSFGWLYGF